MDKKGNRVSGKRLAPDEAALRADLRRQGIAVNRIKKQSQAFKAGGKVKAEDIAVFSRQLATMLAAGIPLVQSFEIVGNGNEKPAMQKLILDIKADVEGGTSLHEALGKHPLHFDDLFVNLVEAGEQAGALETLLDKIATYKEKTEALKKKVKKALFYPTAVMVVAIIVTVILLHVRDSAVRGAVQGLRRGPAGVHPVRHQHVALAAGQLVHLRSASSPARSTRSSTSRSARRRCASCWIASMLKLPIIGPILYKSAIARFARTLSTMFAAGVPLVEALESVAGAMRQHRVRERGAEDARRSRHRPAPAARDGKHRPVPEHGHPDDRGR